VSQTLNIISIFARIFTYSFSVGTSFLWQAVIAYAASTNLSTTDGASFLFYYSTLSAISFWDFGFSLAQASSLNKYLRSQSDFDLDKSIAFSADYFCKYFFLRKNRAIVMAVALCTLLILISYLRSNSTNLSRILTCILLAFAYVFKAPGDSMILLFEVKHNPQNGKAILGFSQLFGSLVVLWMIYLHTITILSIALVFFLVNLLAIVLSYALLQVQGGNGIITVGVTNQIRDHMKSIENSHKLRSDFFVPGIISYASSFLALPISYMIVNPIQIPILNNLLLLTRGLSLPSSILISVYRAKYSSFLQIHQKIRFIKQLTLISFSVTVASISIFLLFNLFIIKGFIESPVSILPFTKIPFSWLSIALINICLLGIISPLTQSVYFSGSSIISRLMMANIIIDFFLSILLGTKYGVLGILIGTLLAGMLTIYYYGFNSLYKLFQNGKVLL
jgi:hypothetical protein